jgi:DNA-binding response OmpR family regulator
MGKKILLVDDDKDLVYGMKVWLRANGYHVFFALDGPTAITLAQEEKPDLILLDIGLPGGDGYLTMTRMQSHLPLAHVPVIIMTAGDASIHEDRALSAGADAFFQKPIDNQQLLAAIYRTLGETKTRPPVFSLPSGLLQATR